MLGLTGQEHVPECLTRNAILHTSVVEFTDCYRYTRVMVAFCCCCGGLKGLNSPDSLLLSYSTFIFATSFVTSGTAFSAANYHRVRQLDKVLDRFCRDFISMPVERAEASRDCGSMAPLPDQGPLFASRAKV